MKCGKRAALGLRVFLLCFFGGVARWGRSASPGSFGSRASGLSQDDWAGGRKKYFLYFFNFD